MSSKVFEYLQAGRPIFAISPAGSAARALFAEVGGGTCVLPDEPMSGPLAAFVRAVRDGEAPAVDDGGLGARTSWAASPPGWPRCSTAWRPVFPRPEAGVSAVPESPSAGAGRADAAAAPPKRRSPSLEVALLAGAVIVLLGFVYGFIHKPKMAVAALLLSPLPPPSPWAGAGSHGGPWPPCSWPPSC